MKGRGGVLIFLTLNFSVANTYSIDDADDLAANVDIVEREQQPTEYFYPSNPQASFVDMPGYGTMKYPDIESYWTDLQLGNFSAFIVFLERVTNLDLSFIEKLKLTKKSFFLVRTKIDVVVENMDKPFNEEDVLSKIREDILKQTKEKRVFLISNYEPYKWDFFQIVEAIMNKMPATQIGEKKETGWKLKVTTVFVSQSFVILLRTHTITCIIPEPTARSAVPGVSPGRGLLIVH